MRTPILISNRLLDVYLHLLARAVARGQTVAEWTRSKEWVDKDADEWSEGPDYPILVELYRLRVTKALVREILRSATMAIEDPEAVCEEPDSKEI